MGRDEAPPFARGGTFYQGATIDSTNYGGVNLEGKQYRFEDTIYGTGQQVIVRCVRNSGTFNLLPKRTVTFDNAFYSLRVNGYTAVSSANGFPVDELLPAAGVPPGDLFYIVIEGPAAILTDLSGGATNVIAVGDPLVAITAVTSGCTTGGRINTINAATTNTATVLMSKLGRACSAVTTAQTNYSLLVLVDNWL